jgi:hypothetical protein
MEIKMKQFKAINNNKKTGEIKFHNPNAPATIKQRLLLRRLTGEVNTGKRFTMQSISKAIEDARNNPPTKRNNKADSKVITLKINGKTVKAQIIS